MAGGPEETEEALRDGRVVTVRPLRAADAVTAIRARLSRAGRLTG